MAEIESGNDNKYGILGESVKIPRDLKLSKQGLEFLKKILEQDQS